MMFQLKITGRTEAEYFSKQMTKMIGLVNPSTEVPTLTIPYHVERFHDVSEDMQGYVKPSREMVERVLDFSKSFTDDDRVLIHCHAGIARSTAIAVAVLVQHGMNVADAFDTVYEVRPHMNPNSLIISIADDILGQNGELVAYHAYWIEEKMIHPENFAGQQPDTSDINQMKDILAKMSSFF